MPVDRIMLGVFNAYFRAAVEAAAFALKRSAYTTYIKESNDFTTGLVTPAGEHFAYPVSVSAQSYVGIHFDHWIAANAPWHAGDIAVSNCAYDTHGVSTHLPDYHMLRPIFWEGKLIAFAWGFIHSSDMGGITPGSILPSAYDYHQEGLRIPPVKLFRAGVLQEDTRAFMLGNVRQPDKNWGDLNALMASLATAEARMHDAVRKWGLAQVEAGRDALVDYAEQRARALIDRLPDGNWSFHDYLEDDVVSDMPIRVKLRVTKSAGGNLHLDYTGSDHQVGAAFNLVSFGHHPFLCRAMFDYFRTADRGLPVNGGLIRPISITAPEGSVVNAVYPAAVGVRHSINMLSHGILQAILAQALPGEIPTAGAAQGSIVAVSIMDPETGRRRTNVIQPMVGGSGARPERDGVDGVDFALSSLANTPTEVLENEADLLIRRYDLVPDSGGPGRFRGGLAARIAFEVFQPDTILTARGQGRFKFQPWGRAGGCAGPSGEAWLNPGTPEAKPLGKINVMRLNPGEIFSLRTPGGGGIGDPFTRDPTRVLHDVIEGKVSPAMAQAQYGVVIAGDAIDAAATQALRAQPRDAVARRLTGWPDDVDAGDGRVAYERIFSAGISDLIVQLLFEIPPAARYHAKQHLFQQLRARDIPATPQAVRDLWHALRP